MRASILAATLGLLLVSPALAQSYNPDCGKGTACPADVSQSPSNGTKARAQEPRRAAPAKRAAPAPSQKVDQNSPASCGGGSSGYNENCGKQD